MRLPPGDRLTSILDDTVDNSCVTRRFRWFVQIGYAKVGGGTSIDSRCIPTVPAISFENYDFCPPIQLIERTECGPPPHVKLPAITREQHDRGKTAGAVLALSVVCGLVVLTAQSSQEVVWTFARLTPSAATNHGRRQSENRRHPTRKPRVRRVDDAIWIEKHPLAGASTFTFEGLPSRWRSVRTALVPSCRA